MRELCNVFVAHKSMCGRVLAHIYDLRKQLGFEKKTQQTAEGCS